MLTLRLIGALLFLCGIVWLVATVIRGGRMSDPGATTGTPADSLEPPRSGLRAVELRRSWPAFALIAAGIVLLLLPLAFAPPPPPPAG